MASQTRHHRSFDVLRATASDLRDQLEDGSITSLEIIEAYLAQIKLHNHAGAKLNAVISMPPRPQLLRTAAELDRECKEGKIRGPLHGIPVLVKVGCQAISSFPNHTLVLICVLGCIRYFARSQDAHHCWLIRVG